jgi:hydrogenase maturation protease
MSSALVLGLGNRLSGADAFGPAVVESLRGAADLPPSVRLVDAHTDLLAYIDQFAQYDRVILVDAVISKTGGGVTIYDEGTFLGWADSSQGAHELSPLMAVKLFRQLGPRQGPEITLVAHVIRDDDFRRAPTDHELAAGVAAVRRVLSGRASTPRSA